MKKGLYVLNLMKKSALLMLVCLVLLPTFGTKKICADTMEDIDGKAVTIDFNHNGYVTTNISDSSVEWENRSTLADSYKMNTETTYSVTYPDALELSDGTTLTIVVEIKLLTSVGDCKILMYTGTGEPYLQKKPRIYWTDAPGAEVEWTVRLYKKVNGDLKPNDISILTGFEDPDESNYYFDTRIRNVYYRQPSDGDITNTTNGYHLVDSTSASGFDGGLIRYGVNVGAETVPGFERALFIVDITDSFTFRTETFKSGTLSVPFFYEPLYTVKYNPNAPAGKTAGGTDVEKQLNYFNLTPVATRQNTWTVDGYRFVGWNTVKDPTASPTDPLVTPVAFDPTTTTNNTYTVPNQTDTNNTFVRSVPAGEVVNLYAQWEPIYTVRYNPNAPAGKTAGGTNVPDQTNAYTTTPTDVSDNTWTVDGYRFVGWNTVKDPTASPTDPLVTPVAFDPDSTDASKNSYFVSDDTNNTNSFSEIVSAGEVVNLYAQWEKQIYKIHYDNGYGGEQTMTSNEYYFEELNMMSKENEFTRPGFRFKGFLYTYPNGNTDPLYIEPNNFRALLIDPVTGPEITLVAQWEELPVYRLPVTGIE